jgi:hypothetical protein
VHGLATRHETIGYKARWFAICNRLFRISNIVEGSKNSCACAVTLIFGGDSHHLAPALIMAGAFSALQSGPFSHAGPAYSLRCCPLMDWAVIAIVAVFGVAILAIMLWGRAKDG